MTTVFKWSDQRRTAALLLAEGDRTDAEIAAQAGVCRKTLWNWKQIPEFAAVVEAHLDAFRVEVRRRGLASRERRVQALNERWARLQRIVAERAADPAMASVPGGATGLLLHHVKVVGAGERARVVDYYELDADLLKELRELEKQAAQELGQWVEKQEAGPRPKAYVTVGPDDL